MSGENIFDESQVVFPEMWKEHAPELDNDKETTAKEQHEKASKDDGDMFRDGWFQILRSSGIDPETGEVIKHGTPSETSNEDLDPFNPNASTEAFALSDENGSISEPTGIPPEDLGPDKGIGSKHRWMQLLTGSNEDQTASIAENHALDIGQQAEEVQGIGYDEIETAQVYHQSPEVNVTQRLQEEDLEELTNHQLVKEAPVDDDMIELEQIRDELLAAGTICQQDVISVEAYIPGIITDKINLRAIGKFPGTVGYDASMEALTTRLKEMLLNGLKRLYDWLVSFGDYLRERYNSKIKDRIIFVDPNRLSNYRTDLLKRAKAVDSVYGPNSYQKLAAKDEVAIDATTTHAYVMEWLNREARETLEKHYSLGFRYIVEGRMKNHVDKLGSFINGEIGKLNNALDKMSKQPISTWSNIVVDKDIRGLKEITAFAGNGGRTGTSHRDIIEAYSSDIQIMFKHPTSVIPTDFLKAIAYTAPFTDGGKTDSNYAALENGVKQAEAGVMKLTNKVKGEKLDEGTKSFTTGFNALNEMLSYIRNLVSIYIGFKGYYSRYFTVLQSVLIKMDLRLRSVEAGGKAQNIANRVI